MANMTLSQDIVGICLVLAKGDANMGLEEVMLEADRFQEANNRHFGIGRRDLRGLFQSLFLWELGADHPLAIRLGKRWKEGAFDGIRLYEIVPIVLEYHDGGFNDEDEMWCGLENGAPTRTRERYEKGFLEDWLGYSWEQYCEKVRIKQAMRQLFHGQEYPDRSSMVQFMKAHGIDDRLLHHCSRPGWSS
jgi:hypothetical protein